MIVYIASTRKKTHVIFNKNGDVIEIQYYNSEGDLIERNEIIYDDLGKRKEENTYNVKLDFLANKRVFIFGDNGNIVEKNEYYSDGSLTEKKVYLYDKQNNIKCIKTFDSDLNLKDSSDYKYDNKGNILEKKLYGIFENTTWYTNQLGEKIENTYRREYRKNKVFKTDKLGNIIEYSELDEDSTLSSRAVSIENKKEKTVEKLFFALDLFGKEEIQTRKQIFTFDDKGNIIKVHNYENKPYYCTECVVENVITYKYDFDNKDNWIKRIEYSDGKPEKIVIREIEYF